MSQFISIFDMLKIGVGPSSSHTLGPWRAAQQWISKLKESSCFLLVDEIKVDLYGSLSLTGRGHATDSAILLGLSGADPEFIPIEEIDTIITAVKDTSLLYLNNEKMISFSIDKIQFNREFLPFNPNGMTFTAFQNKELISKETYYSIGGGFIIQEDDSLVDEIEVTKKNFPYPINRAIQLERYCEQENLAISEIVLQNELVLNAPAKIDAELHRIWTTML